MRAWSFAVASLLALAACADEHFPSRPGGGTHGSGSNGPDAAVQDSGGGDDDAGGRRITGSVCSLDDLRDSSDCASEPSGVGILISGTEISTTSTAGGNFELALDDTVTGDVVYLVAGFATPAYHLSLVPIFIGGGGASGVSVPVVTELVFGTLLTQNEIGEEALGTGSIALYLEDGGQPAEGATVTAPAGTTFTPRYDTGNPQLWADGGETGSFGATLLFGVPEGDELAIDAVNAKLDAINIAPILVVQSSLTFIRTSF
jgi:hypothetical protein